MLLDDNGWKALATRKAINNLTRSPPNDAKAMELLLLSRRVCGFAKTKLCYRDVLLFSQLAGSVLNVRTFLQVTGKIHTVSLVFLGRRDETYGSDPRAGNAVLYYVSTSSAHRGAFRFISQ